MIPDSRTQPAETASQTRQPTNMTTRRKAAIREHLARPLTEYKDIVRTLQGRKPTGEPDESKPCLVGKGQQHEIRSEGMILRFGKTPRSVQWHVRSGRNKRQRGYSRDPLGVADVYVKADDEGILSLAQARRKQLRLQGLRAAGVYQSKSEVGRNYRDVVASFYGGPISLLRKLRESDMEKHLAENAPKLAAGPQGKKQQARSVFQSMRYALRTIRWLDKPLDEIEKSEIVDQLEKIARKSPSSANHHLRSISKVFTYASARGWHKGELPTGGISAYAVDFVNPKSVELNKVKTIWRSLPKDRPGAIAAKLMILSGCRGIEMRSAKKSELDFENRAWIREGSKNGFDLIVHLSPLMIDLFKRAITISPYDSPYIFPKTNGVQEPMTENYLWREFRRAACGVKNWSPKGTRKVFATGLASMGADDDTVSLLQNQIPQSITARHYQNWREARHGVRIQWSNAWSEVWSEVEIDG